MKKTNIRICSSPTCHVESARLFKHLEQTMSAYFKSKTTRVGTACKGICKNCGADAPCVELEGKIIRRASSGKILAALSGI